MSDFDQRDSVRRMAKLHGKMEALHFKNIEVQVEAFDTASKIGVELMVAKKAMRGEYETWLESNAKRLGFCARTARRYKSVARIIGEVGGLESALSDLRTLREMQVALGYTPEEPKTGEASSEESEHARKFELIRMPADTSEVPLEKAQALLARLKEFCQRLSDRIAASESGENLIAES